MNIFRSKFYQTLKRRLAVNTSQESDDQLDNDNTHTVHPVDDHEQSNESINTDTMMTASATNLISSSSSSSGSSQEDRNDILASLDSDQSDDEDNLNHVVPAHTPPLDIKNINNLEEKDEEDASVYASLHADYISLTTSTVPRVYRIEWCIDEESVNFALLKSKKHNANGEDGDNNRTHNSNNGAACAGILDVEVVRDGLTFKLELCISGWKNSNQGYCAFYLTVPKRENKDADQDKDDKSGAVMARYTVSICDAKHSKQSSIRDDFYLGVGFPNFCTENVLLDAVRRSVHQQLWLEIKVEIFESSCEVQSIEHVLLQKYMRQFTSGSSTIAATSFPASASDLRSDLKSDLVKKNQNQLLTRMYTDGTMCDVRIRCQDDRVLQVHKCVLIASSTVFRKMFEVKGGRGGFMESTANEVNLERSLWRCHIVEAMVKFLYLGEIDAAVAACIEDLFELFRIAEYFEIETLVTECCGRFLQSLSPNNACFLLLQFAAHSCRYQHVRQVQFMQRHNILWRFIIKNIKQVQQTPYYQQIVVQQPMILSQLIDKMTSTC